MNNTNTVPMVSPDGRYEVLQKKLEKFQENNFTEKEINKLNSSEYEFARIFIKYCESTIGLSEEQICQLEEADIVCLAESRISKKARKRWYGTWSLLLSNPIGWIALFVSIFIPPDNSSFVYFRELKKLRNAYGKEYFPSKKILEVANRKPG